MIAFRKRREKDTRLMHLISPPPSHIHPVRQKLGRVIGRKLLLLDLDGAGLVRDVVGAAFVFGRGRAFLAFGGGG